MASREDQAPLTDNEMGKGKQAFSFLCIELFFSLPIYLAFFKSLHDFFPFPPP
jgi:hypothetical protein